MTSSKLFRIAQLKPGEPLWQRAPTQDADGNLLNDFMMLIPRLRHRSEVRRQQVMGELQQLFSELEDTVVFADLNLKLNLLWISMRPRPGGCVSLAAEIKVRVPEAVLVASQAEAMVGMARADERRSRYLRLPRWR